MCNNSGDLGGLFIGGGVKLYGLSLTSSIKDVALSEDVSSSLVFSTVVNLPTLFSVVTASSSVISVIVASSDVLAVVVLNRTFPKAVPQA